MYRIERALVHNRDVTSPDFMLGLILISRNPNHSDVKPIPKELEESGMTNMGAKTLPYGVRLLYAFSNFSENLENPIETDPLIPHPVDPLCPFRI